MPRTVSGQWTSPSSSKSEVSSIGELESSSAIPEILSGFGEMVFDKPFRGRQKSRQSEATTVTSSLDSRISDVFECPSAAHSSKKAKKCSICGRSFHPLRRRYQCSDCGGSVCHLCSMSQRGTQGARICVACKLKSLSSDPDFQDLVPRVPTAQAAPAQTFNSPGSDDGKEMPLLTLLSPDTQDQLRNPQDRMF